MCKKIVATDIVLTYIYLREINPSKTEKPCRRDRAEPSFRFPRAGAVPQPHTHLRMAAGRIYEGLQGARNHTAPVQRAEDPSGRGKRRDTDPENRGKNDNQVVRRDPAPGSPGTIVPSSAFPNRRGSPCYLRATHRSGKVYNRPAGATTGRSAPIDKGASR